MKYSNLIIRDELVEPPTDSLAFRTVTMIVHENLDMNVFVHTTPDMKDLYYQFMKPRGLLDYVDYIIAGTEFESGIWISSSGMVRRGERMVMIGTWAPVDIIVKCISFENQVGLLGRIKSLSGKE